MNSWRKNPNIYSRQPRRGSVEALMRRINALESGIAGGSGYTFDFEYGTSGTGTGQFVIPNGIAFDASNRAHVTDYGIGRRAVLVFDSSGVFQFEYTNGGTFFPVGIAFDASNRAHVVDRQNDAVIVFNSSGVFQFEYGTSGTGVGEMEAASGITIDTLDRAHVTDDFRDRVLVFDNSGVFQFEYGTSGTGVGEFTTPFYPSVDGAGQIHIPDQARARVLVFNSSGVFQFEYGTSGTGVGEFTTPRASAVDSSGRVHITDFSRDRVLVFDNSGVFQFEYGTSGTGAGEFDGPFGIAIDSTGQPHVIESNIGRDRVFVFNPSGTYSQTTFSLYTRNGTPVSLGTPDAGVSVPSPYALSDYPAWLHPQHIVDMRTAIQAMASYFNNPATGNPYNFTDGSADNLYYVAMGDRRAYGGSRGPRYTWTRTGLEMLGTPTYDIDIGEIHECVRQLEAS